MHNDKRWFHENMYHKINALKLRQVGAGPLRSRAQTQTENEFADIASHRSREISGEHSTHKIGGCWRKDLESTTSDPGKAEHAGNFEFFLGNYLQSLIRIFL